MNLECNANLCHSDRSGAKLITKPCHSDRSKAKQAKWRACPEPVEGNLLFIAAPLAATLNRPRGVPWKSGASAPRQPYKITWALAPEIL